MFNKATQINTHHGKTNKKMCLSDLELTPNRRRKISSRLLVGLWSLVSLACVTFGFPHKVGASDAPEPTSTIAGTVSVATGQGQVNNIARVAVKLSGPSAGSASQSALTDESGSFRFPQLAAGVYTVEVNVEGFKPWTKVVALAPGQAAVEDATLEISTVEEKIEVQGENLDVSTQSAETTGTITNRELEALPLAEQKFTEALPLSPGVIRTPEGRVNFNGQAENQGILLVNSTENVDPVTGSFAIPVPVDVIQSMSVHSSPDTAEFGGFSGGLTEIETRPALDAWNFKLHDVSPSFRGKNDHLVGIGAFTPRMVFGGPLIKGKLNFTEELTYEVRNVAVRGLSWPFNEIKTRSVTSFTQWQFILSPRHLLDVNLNVFPLRRQFADINALVPQSASNTYGQNGVSVGISDGYQFSSGGLLNTVVRYTRFDSHAHGQGPEDMLVTPDGWGGNFFNSWSRNANELEIRPAFQFPEKSWHGRHEFKIGVDLSRRSFVGTDISRPIQVLRQDNSVAEQITFQGRSLQNGASTEVGEFVEDHWALDSHLAIDMGARLSSQSIGRRAALGSHIGLAYSPGENGRTILRATAGTVYGHVPLLAASFLDDPTRVISFFDPSGRIIGGPISLQNAYLQSNGGSGPQFVPALPRTSPRTFTWSVEVEREIRRNVSLKVGYLDSQTRNLFVVDPVIGATANGSALALANNGTTHYRRIEATLHARPFEHGDLNVSYVWSRSRGDLNTLAQTYMPFEEPVIRPNASGILPSDVPHRVVTWGIFSLPWKLTFSPVVDVRTGLPYSNVDVLQNYVGVPNSQRFPTFFSLDGKIYREFPLQLPFMEKSKKIKIRLGVYTNNLTNHRNPHDVFSNVGSPMFGQFAGFQRRIDGFVIDFVD
jgi:hypothetical protein